MGIILEHYNIFNEKLDFEIAIGQLDFPSESSFLGFLRSSYLLAPIWRHGQVLASVEHMGAIKTFETIIVGILQIGLGLLSFRVLIFLKPGCKMMELRPPCFCGTTHHPHARAP